MQAVAGIHKDRNLPRFHRETFTTWFERRRAPRPPPPGGRPASAKVALFATCTVDYNDPAIGRAAVRVLERNGVDVTVPAQRCCGMPYLDGGDVEECRGAHRATTSRASPPPCARAARSSCRGRPAATC